MKMKTIEANGNTYTKKDHEELIRLCEEFLKGDTRPEANRLRAAVMSGYDKWDESDKE
jgi:hypothetical protein